MTDVDRLKSSPRVISWQRLLQDRLLISGPDLVWPTLEADAEFELIKFEGKVFIQPVFRHVVLRETEFVGCTFVNPVFNNVVFEDCVFHECEFSSGMVNSCRLDRCLFYASVLSHLKFLDSDLAVEADSETNLVAITAHKSRLLSESLALEDFAVIEGEILSHNVVKR